MFLASSCWKYSSIFGLSNAKNQNTVIPQESGVYILLSFDSPTPSISSSAGDLITEYPLDIRYLKLFDKIQILGFLFGSKTILLLREH